MSNNFRHIKGHPTTRGDIIIENDVWIGANVTILSGVNIGNGAVIGANSLITKDTPPYCIASGSPAEFKRFRFEKNIIIDLQKIAWWNLDIEIIEKHVSLLQSNKIEEFIKISR